MPSFFSWLSLRQNRGVQYPCRQCGRYLQMVSDNALEWVTRRSKTNSLRYSLYSPAFQDGNWTIRSVLGHCQHLLTFIHFFIGCPFSDKSKAELAALIETVPKEHPLINPHGEFSHCESITLWKSGIDYPTTFRVTILSRRRAFSPSFERFLEPDSPRSWRWGW